MHILVIGAAGMVGRKLVARLAQDGGLAGRPIDALTLVDVVAPAAPAGFSGAVETVTADLSAPGAADCGSQCLLTYMRVPDGSLLAWYMAASAARSSSSASSAERSPAGWSVWNGAGGQVAAMPMLARARRVCCPACTGAESAAMIRLAVA